ncbi:hypothetical protein WR25_25378 [Diploscapter pachys]|uniref:UMP-CMP kinase n=1 Tax=Diploscapter pachys TaxID=2018661 RepID=A0A2A2JRM9_9BILA|nr:hypothetical protein WR25_25378 [Diploscapter pachys]
MTGDSSQKLFKVVFILGPPGSGKGTCCHAIQKNHGLIHLSAGDLLREERQREGSEVGALIEAHIRNGTIVPVEITCMFQAMRAAGDSAKGFLVDGFPRNQDNLDGWKRQMSGKVDEKFVLFLTCPTDDCIKRCLNRGEGRSDDNEESFRKRIDTYNSQTLPIVEFYKKQGLVREVNSGRPIEQVLEDVERVFTEAGF